MSRSSPFGSQLNQLYKNCCSVIPIFKSAAEELMSTSGLTPVELLAKALAKTTVSSVFDYIY